MIVLAKHTQPFFFLTGCPVNIIMTAFCVGLHAFMVCFEVKPWNAWIKWNGGGPSQPPG